ncbi:hypothetical protein FRC00_011044 [Tulasnella sp. 408]|nr:hypothetical protein FRC00_011044 [Tulasnella sp. 408]
MMTVLHQPRQAADQPRQLLKWRSTLALGSDDIENPASQADATETDANEEDEADARLVDCSLELICSPTPSHVPPPHERARLDEQVPSPVEDEDVSVPSPRADHQILAINLTTEAVFPGGGSSFHGEPKASLAEASVEPQTGSLEDADAASVRRFIWGCSIISEVATSAETPKGIFPAWNCSPFLIWNSTSTQRVFAGNGANPSTPTFGQEIRSDDIEACVTEAPVIGSSGLKRQRSSEDRREEEENETPARRRLSRTASVPVPKHVEPTSSRNFLRTYSLSAEGQRSLQQVVGSPRQLSIADLKSLSVVLSSFQEELNAAIEQKSKDGEHGL